MKSSKKSGSEIHFTNIIIFNNWIFKNISFPLRQSSILSSSCPASSLLIISLKKDNEVICKDCLFGEGEKFWAVTGTYTTVSISSAWTVWVLWTALNFGVLENLDAWIDANESFVCEATDYVSDEWFWTTGVSRRNNDLFSFLLLAHLWGADFLSLSCSSGVLFHRWYGAHSSLNLLRFFDRRTIILNL